MTEKNLERKLKVLEEKALREKTQKPKCIHYNYCNGCPLMTLPYEEQLKLKESFLKEIFASLPAKEKEIKIEQSERQFFYRNKLELSFIDGRLGFKLKNSWKKCFQVKECLLMSEKSNEIITFLSKELEKQRIEGYNPVTKKGLLSYVTLREAKKTNDFMVVFTLKKKEKMNAFNGIAKQLMNLFGVSSIYFLLNETTGDTAFGEIINCFGKEFIEEKFLDLKFRFNALSFFQANVFQAEKLFSEIVSQIKKNDSILDLFSGIGTLTLPTAVKAEKVTGIELNEHAVKFARLNAELNEIKNVTFIQGKVRTQLKFFKEKPNIITLDPPRAGCCKKTIQRILNLKPEFIYYISCNPESQKRDLEMLLKGNEFRLKELKAFDFFPQTRHIEMLAVLERKN